MPIRYLGKRVRRAREARGLSRPELTATCDQKRSKNFLDQIEDDRSKPSLETLVWLCDQLGVSADWLLGRTRNGGP
jgi:transcriptional regulator with XRE-family HTH domain